MAARKSMLRRKQEEAIAALLTQRNIEEAAADRALDDSEDVAHAILFICSEAGWQIVGQTIVVDGGLALT
jgi:NAD(P)-dependent dehydrogenase (short-subunit alcohol dehydrogenase family)